MLFNGLISILYTFSIESCYTIKYKGKPLDFQQDPMNMWWPEASGFSDSPNFEEEPLEMRFFYMYYTTADEIEFNTGEIIDLATFIGSVGGTLGLYLGFSFLGMLFPLFDYAEAAYAGWSNSNKIIQRKIQVKPKSKPRDPKKSKFKS